MSGRAGKIVESVRR